MVISVFSVRMAISLILTGTLAVSVVIVIRVFRVFRVIRIIRVIRVTGISR
jgi:hypothetical protein